MTNLTIEMLEKWILTNSYPVTHHRLTQELLAVMQREAEYLSIFRRCRDIVAFHSGDDREKVEAIRRTLLQAPHLKGVSSEYSNE